MAIVSKLPPFPPSGNFINAVKSSTRSLRLASGVVIRTEAIKRLLCSERLSSSLKALPASHGRSLPLNFPSVLAELNVISILSLLNFGSGYDVPLQRATGRDAWDTIRAFVLSLYLTSSVGGEGDFLSARGMQNITVDKVAESMGVSVYMEKPHETIPGLTIGVLGGPMYEFVKLVAATMNETGRVLVDSRYPNLGSFVAEALRDSTGATREGNSDAAGNFVLERLVRAIPAFRDMAMINDQPIYCFRNALFLLHAIDVRFGAISPPPFPVPPTSHITFFADSVICSIFIHLGIIDISMSAPLSSLSSHAAPDTSLTGPSRQDLAKEAIVLTEEQVYVLRAASINACMLIVENARSLETDDSDVPECIKDITVTKLDRCVRTVAKAGHDYVDLTTFTQRGTVFF